MFYITFETQIPPANRSLSSQYYTKLQGLVQSAPGFVAETGFTSMTVEGKRLLFVRFLNEESAHQWRVNPVHLNIQAKARYQIYTDYRLRVGPEALLDTEHRPETARTDTNGMLLILEHSLDDIASSERIDWLLSCLPQITPQIIDTYANARLKIHLIPLQDTTSAHELVQALESKGEITVYCMGIIREYGNNDRTQAPGDADELHARYADPAQLGPKE